MCKTVQRASKDVLYILGLALFCISSSEEWSCKQSQRTDRRHHQHNQVQGVPMDVTIEAARPAGPGFHAGMGRAGWRWDSAGASASWSRKTLTGSSAGHSWRAAPMLGGQPSVAGKVGRCTPCELSKLTNPQPLPRQSHMLKRTAGILSNLNSMGTMEQRKQEVWWRRRTEPAGKYEAIFFNTCAKSKAKDMLAKVQKDVWHDIYCSAICNHKKLEMNPKIRW